MTKRAFKLVRGRGRWIIGGGLLLCLPLIITEGFIVWPAERETRVFLQALQQQHDVQRSLRTQLKRLPRVAIIDAQSQKIAARASPTRNPFSILQVSHHVGGRLIHWAVEGDRADMTLLLGWDKLPAFFGIMAQRAVLIHAFNIAEASGAIKVTVWLQEAP
ncbi:hypothetical protein [Erwinia sp. HR93]|uniref:HofO family protein n=1 Tax=Erwinia sp. HR93 TaxID=3094840 RepID=UPI002ADED6EE|nr:hypothetical protein [Erwinia sp. HR93]MEA1063106.1 hypothetical protein [Erwinia sp. HR93]